MLTTENIPLWAKASTAIRLVRYHRHSDTTPRPAMIVVPGGGYATICNITEGYPIADRFLALGFNVFILHYHCRPEVYPTPQRDLLRAIKLVRFNHKEWNVIPDNIAIVGFSAGGHLCACAGTLYDKIEANNGDEADPVSARPDCMILCYSVITCKQHAYVGLAPNLLGHTDSPQLRELISLEKQVTSQTTPAYIWHTIEDQAVPVQNSLLMAEAMRKKQVPVSLQIFPFGHHGMQLGQGHQDIAFWPQQAVAFAKSACHFQFPAAPMQKTVILTFDDAVKNHLTFVAPLLRKFNFNATFFICRFSDEWQKEHGDAMLDEEELRQLHQLGFELGNHTWNHTVFPPEQWEKNGVELSRINQLFTEAKVPLPISFAYPGGPFHQEMAKMLPLHGLRYGRTTEQRPFYPKSDPPNRIPAFPMQGKCLQQFIDTVNLANEHQAVVIVFHGIPDTVHPWVNTTPSTFRRCMQYLHDNNFNVLSLKQFMESQLL